MAASSGESRRDLPGYEIDRTGIATDRVYPSYYMRQVWDGRMMLADVPAEWRDCVASMLELPAYNNACTALEAKTPSDIRKSLDSLPAAKQYWKMYKERKAYEVAY